jgi:hypothetical protein
MAKKSQKRSSAKRSRSAGKRDLVRRRELVRQALGSRALQGNGRRWSFTESRQAEEGEKNRRQWLRRSRGQTVRLSAKNATVGHVSDIANPSDHRTWRGCCGDLGGQVASGHQDVIYGPRLPT